MYFQRNLWQECLMCSSSRTHLYILHQTEWADTRYCIFQFSEIPLICDNYDKLYGNWITFFIQGLQNPYSSHIETSNSNSLKPSRRDNLKCIRYTDKKMIGLRAERYLSTLKPFAFWVEFYVSAQEIRQLSRNYSYKSKYIILYRQINNIFEVLLTDSYLMW